MALVGADGGGAAASDNGWEPLWHRAAATAAVAAEALRRPMLCRYDRRILSSGSSNPSPIQDVASSPAQPEDDFMRTVGVMISKSVVQVQEGCEHILGSDD